MNPAASSRLGPRPLVRRGGPLEPAARADGRPAFAAAYPVNRYLLQRGKGHALTHEYHGAAPAVTGLRRRIPDLASTTLAAVIISFMLGGFLVAAADELESDQPASEPTSKTH